MHYRRNIVLAYLFSLFYSTTLVASVWMIFYFNRGFTLADLMIWDAIYQASLVLSEVPSGLLADRWGRKNTLLLGCAVMAFKTLATVLWGFNMLAVSLLWVLEGFSQAMFSDTIDSLLYDSLPAAKREKMFVKVTSRFNAISCVAYGVGALGGSLLTVSIPLPVLYALSAGFFVLAFIIAMFMKEPRRVSQAYSSLREVTLLLRKSWLIIKCSHKLVGLIFYASFVGVIYYLFWEYYQPYLERMAMPIYLFGVVVVIMSIAEGVVPLFASWLVKKIKHLRKFCSYSLIVLAALVLVFSVAVGWLGLTALVAIIGVTSLLLVITNVLFQKEVTADCRTTTKSVQTVIYRVMVMLSVLLAASALEKIDFLVMFKVFGVFVLVIGLLIGLKKSSKTIKLPSSRRRC